MSSKPTINKYLNVVKLAFTLPLAIIFDVITRIRNWLYDFDVFQRSRYAFPVICIGNLQMGGTGKTPHTEWLISRLLEQTDKQILLLSRGYGRKTKGFILANEMDNSETIGDEPYQIWAKYRSKIQVIVCEKRSVALDWVKENVQNPVVIMDDGFQHRAVVPGYSIILSPANKLFFEDYLFPAGNLRESKVGINRANALIITKLPPDFKSLELAKLVNSLPEHIKSKEVYLSRFIYESIRNESDETLKKGSQVVAIAGIADASSFFNFLKSEFALVKSLNFNDHHNYSGADFSGLEDIQVICTEKDFAKITKVYKKLGWNTADVYFLPIKVVFEERDPLNNLLAYINATNAKA